MLYKNVYVYQRLYIKNTNHRIYFSNTFNSILKFEILFY